MSLKITGILRGSANAARLRPAARNIPRRGPLNSPPVSRHISNVPHKTSFPMPANMPREDYAAPTMYTLSYMSRVFRLVLYGAVGLGISGIIAFEGFQLYIEKNYLSTPTGPSDDPYGWQEENQAWTGIRGTDPRLGWKARHALRGAWICQEWGAGGASSTISRSVHPEVRGMIGTNVNRVDRGFELAEQYIDLAISEAKRRNITFPPNVSTVAGTPKSQKSAGDRIAIDLLLLKAGVLERIATSESLRQAGDIYQRVLAATESKARSMRLAGKIGDLVSRTGGDPSLWWTWGLERVDLKAPLDPPAQRAAISILISMEAALATSGKLKQAAQAQELAQSLIASSQSLPRSVPSAQLHDLWVKNRSAVLNLHRAGVQHALKKPALPLAAAAQQQADQVLEVLPSPDQSSPLYPASIQLRRDTSNLAAESAYTRGLLLEKTDMETAVECFDRAMSLCPEERGSDWDKYYRGFARVKGKLEKAIDQELNQVKAK